MRKEEFDSNNSNMTTETVAEVIAEFKTFLNDSIAAHAFASLGLRRLAEWLGSMPVIPENPDPTIYVGIGDPSTPEAKQYARWRRSDAIAQAAINGPIETVLGQQWIVYLYTAWEHEYRGRLAKAHGCDKDDLRYPLLGDLKRLRHDVVHHRGVATKQQTGRCEVLGHWFAPGHVIRLEGWHFAEFVERFPWASLERGPLGP